jgi:hypothetical protein
VNTGRAVDRNAAVEIDFRVSLSKLQTVAIFVRLAERIWFEL